MWLPEDERILLSYYYSQGRPGHICQRDPSVVIKELCERKNQVDETYVMNVLKSLQKYGLIEDVKKVRNTNQIEVRLTQEAINLGKKYSSKIGTLSVWITEYKWLWVFLSVLTGIVVIIVTIVKD